MRKLISILLLLALMLVLIPSTVAYAATSGTTTGTFSVGGVAPNVSALQVYSDAGCTLTAGSLTPQVLYYVKVTASDPNTLNDIKQVKLKVYYDATAAHPDESTITTGQEQTVCIFTWTKSTDTWAKDAGGGTSWTVVSTSSVTPTMTASTGDWIFAIKLGKVATETVSPAVWDLHARVTDNANLTAGFYCYNKQVNWYGEVRVNTPNINFSEVALGSGFSANVNKVTDIEVTFISNGNFSIRVTSSATWNGSANIAILDPNGLCLNTNEFGLMGASSDNFGSATILDSTGVPSGPGTQTFELGMTILHGTFWLKVASVFPSDSYSGSVTYAIENR